MKKLEWCLEQKKGIKLVEPSENLAIEYLNSAEESLRVLAKIKTDSKMWVATTKYYVEYFTFYAFLMRIGVKTEIHSCTIELARYLEEHGFIRKNVSAMLEDDKKLRIENQYYLKNLPISTDLKKLRNFILEIKELIDGLTESKVQIIRASLKTILE
ncbi:MAG: hypothetical protein KAT28_03040 [Candidatus Aenigmarchaeota archaeon]|nr:hypothetical protein [Candidatus Aenigmarchaeota archaeon]